MDDLIGDYPYPVSRHGIDPASDPWEEPRTGVPAGQPVRADAVQVGRDVEWLAIYGDGREAPHRGHVWADAPPLGGMRAWWVMPHEPAEQATLAGAVLVVRASRRHQVGRRDQNGRWNARGGRFVDVGTLYVHTDPASAQSTHLARLSTDLAEPPTRIRMPALDLVILRGLSNWYANRPLGVIHGGSDY